MIKVDQLSFCPMFTVSAYRCNEMAVAVEVARSLLTENPLAWECYYMWLLGTARYVKKNFPFQMEIETCYASMLCLTSRLGGFFF
jgi:hypothetical protein